MVFEEDHADEEWVADDDEPDDEDDLLVCPSCSEKVHEDSQKCPYCGDWIVPVYPNQRSRRFFFGAVAILVAIAFLFAILR